MKTTHSSYTFLRSCAPQPQALKDFDAVAI